MHAGAVAVEEVYFCSVDDTRGAGGEAGTHHSDGPEAFHAGGLGDVCLPLRPVQQGARQNHGTLLRRLRLAPVRSLGIGKQRSKTISQPSIATTWSPSYEKTSQVYAGGPHAWTPPFDIEQGS